MTTTINNTDLLATVTDLIEKFDEKTEKKVKAKKEKKEPKPKKEKVKKLTKKEVQITEMANQTFLPNHYKTVWTEQELEKLASALKLASYITIDSETMGVNPFSDQIVGLSLFFNGFGYYIPLKHSQQINEDFDKTGKFVGRDYVDCLALDLVADTLRPLLEDQTKKYIFHNFKFDYHVFKNWMNIDMVAYYDTAIAQSLLDETVSRRLKDLATMYLKIPSDTFSTLFGKVTFNNVPILLNEDGSGNLATYYATKDAELTMKLFDFQMSHIDTPRLADIKKLLFDLEMPFLHIVAKAEQKGVLLDTDYLVSNVKVSLEEKLKDLITGIYNYTGEINLNSPIQVSEALYERLGIKRVDKKKPNSTDKRILNKIKKEHPVIPLFLQYKSLSKLITAFVDKLPLSTVKGRIHTSFNTLGAKCVSKGTLLLTSKGIVKIEDLSSNREVDTFSDINISVASIDGLDSANGFYYGGVNDALEFTLYDNTTITTSLVHPLLTNYSLNQVAHHNKVNQIFSSKLKNYSWQKASEIKNGDYITIKINTNLYATDEYILLDNEGYFPQPNSQKKHQTIPNMLNEDLALWLGMYVADGSLHESNGGLSVRLHNTSEEVLNLFMELNKKLFNDAGTFYVDKGKCPYITLSGKHTLSFIRDTFNLCKKAHNKDIPDLILKSKKSVQEAFIKGLSLDTSARKKNHRTLVFESVSYNLVQKLRVMLLNMGIYCSFYIQGKYLAVAIHGDFLNSYIDSIGLIEHFKQEHLTSLKHTNIFKGTIFYDDLVYVKVKNIKTIKAELFDITVPKTHSFIGNGVINHNTGRMSSNSPNLQQIPNADGGLIRKAFKADEGRLLASIDFSSQELRWLAHFSKDPVLNDIYMNDKDVHCMTATSMYNLQHPEDEISYEFFELCYRNYGSYVDKNGTKLEEKFNPQLEENIKLIYKAKELGYERTVEHIVEYGQYFDKLRKQAKSVNFGIVYGIGEYKLADMLEIDEEQAKQYIQAYFNQYPNVKVWMEEQKQFMRKNLYTQTYLKRKRRVHQEMMADKAWEKERGFRMGINAIIQGSSADQVKIASIKLQSLLKELDAQIVLWVHDEVIFDVPESIGKHNLQRIADVMCNCVQLSCGMKSDIEVGKIWSEKLNDNDLENFEGEDELDEFEEFSQAGY